ncbi:MAG TPA: hypothetical protein H9915_09355 [Candidatus Gemmiger faecigallinarum]|nr:hypothetical protein [Candidatus Gemmiger faecigallinarum]
MKQKFISLGLALAMLLGVAGCNVTTPATVGTIGGVEIPAGIYLLAQYNAYNTTADLVDFATGESASDVSVVLNAEVTGTINGEEVTTDGADYISRLTMSAVEYYAAVEKMFDELGATLEDAATSEVAQAVDSMWTTNGDLYQANGIGRTSLEAYLNNAQKARACMEVMYGPDGQQPVSDEEYEQFITEDCRYIESVTLPMVNYSNFVYAFNDEEMNTAINDIADDCLAYLQQNAGGSGLESYTALYGAASQYLPQVMSVMGSTMESAQTSYYIGSQLYLPDDLAGYDDGDGGNVLTDPLDAAPGEWVKIDLTSSIVLARAVDPFSMYDLSAYQSNYDLLTAYKLEEFQTELYEQGAAMEHALDQGALGTYSASNIKYSV